MAGVKGRSGIKGIATASKDGRAKLGLLLPKALAIIERALDHGDEKMAVWVAEMKIGKPAQQVNIDLDYYNRGLKFLEELKAAQLKAQGSPPALPEPVLTQTTTLQEADQPDGDPDHHGVPQCALTGDNFPAQTTTLAEGADLPNLDTDIDGGSENGHFATLDTPNQEQG